LATKVKRLSGRSLFDGLTISMAATKRRLRRCVDAYFVDILFPGNLWFQRQGRFRRSVVATPGAVRRTSKPSDSVVRLPISATSDFDSVPRCNPEQPNTAPGEP